MSAQAIVAALTWCRHHLLSFLALAFMLGIGAARQLSLQAENAFLAHGFASLPLNLLVLIGLGLLVLIGILLIKPRHALVLAGIPLFFCTGLLHGWQALEMPPDTNRVIRRLDERSQVTLHGRILDMVEFDGNLSRCTVAAQGLLHHARHDAAANPRIFQPVSGKVALRLRGQLPPNIQPGTAIMALGWAERPKKRPERGPADPALIQAAKGIDATLWLQSPDALIILPEHEPTFSERLRFAPEQFRQKTARFVREHLPPEPAGVYQALLIGSYQGLSEEQLELFKMSGTLHILAISGLHLSLIGGMAAAVFYWLLRRSTWILLHSHAPTVALVLTAPVLFLYAALAGLNIPVLRALLSALLVLFAVALRRRRVHIHLLAGAALLVLALHPLALFTASFQLSFSAVAAIILLVPRLPFFNLKAASSRRSKALALVVSLMLVSVAASIGTLPFMLYHFNRVSLIGPLMNLLIEPLLCLWALPLGLIAMLLLSVLPQVAALLLQMGSLSIKLSLFVLKVAAQIPYACLWTITPHPAEMLLFLLIVLLLLHNRPGRRYRRLAACCLSVALVLSFTNSLRLHRDSREARISFIDVGQGAATLVELPTGKRVLIDAGGYHLNGYDVGSRLIAPYLRQRRIWRLDAVLVSHADADHYSGMPFILRHFKPKKLYINTYPSTYGAYPAMLVQAQQQGMHIRPVAGRAVLFEEPGLILECYGVKAEEETALFTDNDRSLLVRLAFGRRALLLPGDSAARREQLLLESQGSEERRKEELHGEALRADLLLAGHHGSIGSTSPAFLDVVQPKVIVVSAGASRRGIHPATQHLRLWQEKGIPVFSTATSGSIIARTNGEELCVQAGRDKQCFD
ncbi:MAG: DNA internalization-related competence protein ComEC/Rec2 [bacterium]|nr:DNA internalization-related competence protein ComEC/Rec2 [bacterium]